MEIYRKEWGPEDNPDGTIINATILDDESLRIDGTDYGKSARNFSGNEDYDYGLHIPANQVSQFTLELLKRGFNLKGPLSVSKVARLCRNAEIETTSWRA